MIASDFVIPKFVSTEEGKTEDYTRFVVEPFERGYGTTIGNSLRRILLASLEGSAVTAVRIEGVQHEFSAVPGVQEDVTDIALNFKRCQIRLNQKEPVIFSFKHKGEGEVTAGEIFKDQNIDIYNPGQLVYTSTTASTEIEMEIKVARGRGYVTAENFELEHAPIGTIYLDANFSPVQRVNFMVEDARVGQQTDYDRLILEIWTNGSITPEKALEEAAGLLIDHVRIFVKQERDEHEDRGAGGPEDPELARKLARPVDELELSVRAANCLKAADIKTIADLVVRSESEMLKFHNFGKKSLDEIKSILEGLELELGMNLPGYPKSTPATDDQEEEVEEEAAVAAEEEE